MVTNNQITPPMAPTKKYLNFDDDTNNKSKFAFKIQPMIEADKLCAPNHWINNNRHLLSLLKHHWSYIVSSVITHSPSVWVYPIFKSILMIIGSFVLCHSTYLFGKLAFKLFDTIEMPFQMVTKYKQALKHILRCLIISLLG